MTGTEPVAENPAVVDGRLDAAAAAVAEARRLIARGGQGRPEAMARAVADALRLAGSPTAAGGRPDRLVNLLDEAERLVEAVERERTAAGLRLRELATRGRAGRAYAGGR